MGEFSIYVSSIFIKIFLKRSMFYTIHKIVLYSLVQWRAVIGIFNSRSLVISKNLICNMSKNLGSIFECLFFCFYCFKSVSFFVNFFVYLFSSAIPWRYRTKFRFKKKKMKILYLFFIRILIAQLHITKGTYFNL